MTTRYRLLTIVVLAGLLLGLTAPVVALAQGPAARGAANTPMHHGGGRSGPGNGGQPGPGHGGHPGPGHGGHYGGWGQNAMLDGFATALGMTPSELVERIEGGASLLSLTGLSREDLVAAVVGEMTEWMEVCLQAGHMSEAQYEWMQERLAEHVDWLIDNPEALVYEWHHGATFGMGWGGNFGGLIWAAADVLGLNTWDIHNALYEGQTIADIAQDIADETGANVNDLIQTIIDEFVAPRAEALQAAVAAGQLDADQAEALLQDIREYAEWLIYNTPPMGQFGHGYGGGGCH